MKAKKAQAKRVVMAPPVEDGIDAFRSYMSPICDRYSDSELRVLQRDLYAMAVIAVELYLQGVDEPESTIEF